MKLEGFSDQPRHGVVFQVKENILDCGGAIIDHQQFSNHLLRLSIEIRGAQMSELISAVESAGVTLLQASVDQAREQAREEPETGIAGSLVIRFLSNEPDLSIPVPAIPG